MSNHATLSGLAMVACCIACHTANATSVPAAKYFRQTKVEALYSPVVSQMQEQPGTTSADYCSSDFCGFTSATAGTDFSATALATATTGSGGTFYAAAQVWRYFQVIGPGNIQVPLRIDGVVSISRSGGVNANAGIAWHDGSAQLGSFSICAGVLVMGEPCSYQLPQFVLSLSRPVHADFSLAANTVGFAVVYAYGRTQLYGPGGHLDAFADPVVSIEPSFAAAHPEYSLELSAMVPEPPAIWLALSGIAALATRRMFGRRTAAVPNAG